MPIGTYPDRHPALCQPPGQPLCRRTERWGAIKGVFRSSTFCALALLASGLQASPAPQPLTGESAPAPLAGYFRSVIDEAPAVAAARAAVAEAEAAGRAAGRPLYNPELELEVESAAEESAAVGIQQTLDWSDRRAAGREAAEAELRARRADLREARVALAGELLDALIALRTAEAKAALADRRLRLMEQFQALAERRSRAGDLGAVELELAVLTLSQARMEAALASAEVAVARQAVSAITGEGGPWPALPDEPPEVRSEALQATQRALLLPRVVALRERVGAAGAEVELRRRERRPAPTVGLRGGMEGDSGLIGLSLSVPLYVRNDYSAEVEVAASARLRLEAELHDVVRRAVSAMESSLANYRLVASAWKAWRDSGLASLTAQIRLLQRLWSNGEIDTTDYLVQLGQSLDTRVSALELRGRLWQAWGELLVTSGEVERWLGLPPIEGSAP